VSVREIENIAGSLMAKKTRKAQGHPTNTKKSTVLPQGVKLFRTFGGHSGRIHSVAFDPTGLMLASGGDDQTVKLWAANRGELLGTLDGHDSSVFSVVFDPEGSILASGSKDGTAAICSAH
jgi:WD40 repeat protein